MRYTVEVIESCDACGHSQYMVHDTVLDNDADCTVWYSLEAAENECEAANRINMRALHSPAVTALLDAVDGALYFYRGVGQGRGSDVPTQYRALEAAAEAVRKERGE